jgi:hypothetical protein
MSSNHELIARLEACREGLMAMQVACAQLRVPDRPSDVSRDFYDRVIAMTRTIEEFCASQRALLDAVQRRLRV